MTAAFVPIDLAKFEQVKASGDLPSPKGVALTIMRLSQQENVTLTELARVINADPAFAGRLVKTANAAHGAGRRPVVAVPDALKLVGVTAVRNLALGFSLLSTYGKGSCSAFDYDRFWSHSLVRGIALQALMLKLRAVPADEAFCLGLLAQIGDLSLATLFPGDYAPLLQEARDRAALRDMEQQAFAMSHHQLTAAMLLDWGLPQALVAPVFFHETPADMPYEEGSRPFVLAQALVLAGHIADICLANESDWRSMVPQLFLLGGRLSMDAETLMAICDGVTQDWRDWGALLSVKSRELPPFEELSKPPAAPQIADGKLLADGEDGYRMRVLVVDDERSMRAMIRALLEEVGHEVFEAESGEQALEMALELRPEIMIVDWVMKGMSGIALTQALRETATGRGIYILLLTSLEADEALVEAFEHGVDDFMVKPLKPRVLAARLRAGQRVVKLQQEVERDREEIRRFAAELAVANRRLQQVALTDALTGFPNRRYAMERIQQEWAGAERHQRPLACMVVDLDSFKQINDTHGHDVGDAVLKQTAAALKSGLRAQDVVCRTGGDEFLVICPDTTLEAALQCAERMRCAVERSAVMAAGKPIQSSVSIGVAVREPRMKTVDDFIKRADQGAYAAKGRGRNQVASVQERA